MPLKAGMGYENSAGLVSGQGFAPRKIDTVKRLQDTYPSNRTMFLGSFVWIFCQWKKGLIVVTKKATVSVHGTTSCKFCATTR